MGNCIVVFNLGCCKMKVLSQQCFTGLWEVGKNVKGLSSFTMQSGIYKNIFFEIFIIF